LEWANQGGVRYNVCKDRRGTGNIGMPDRGQKRKVKVKQHVPNWRKLEPKDPSGGRHEKRVRRKSSTDQSMKGGSEGEPSRNEKEGPRVGCLG